MPSRYQLPQEPIRRLLRACGYTVPDPVKPATAPTPKPKSEAPPRPAKLDLPQEVLNAILRGSQGTYVYVVAADNTVAARTVKVGGTQAAQTEVLEGLTPGDSVVVDGFDKLKPGAKVSVVQRPAR